MSDLAFIVESVYTSERKIVCDFFDGKSSRKLRSIIDPDHIDSEMRSCFILKNTKKKLREEKKYLIPDELLNPSLWTKISPDLSLIFSYEVDCSSLDIKFEQIL